MNTGQIQNFATTENFTIVPNEILRRPDLSARAKGLICYLLSLPKDWVIYKTEISKHFSEGREAISTAFDELVEAGYIIAVQQFNGSQFAGWNYCVFSEPQKQAENPSSEFPIPENPKSENPSLLNTNNTKNLKTKNRYIYVPSIDEVKAYFIENGYRADVAIKAYEYYQSADWHDSRGQRVRNWKQKMRGVWFKPENKLNTEYKIASGKPLL